jgi:hypothetical protein
VYNTPCQSRQKWNNNIIDKKTWKHERASKPLPFWLLNRTEMKRIKYSFQERERERESNIKTSGKGRVLNCVSFVGLYISILHVRGWMGIHWPVNRVVLLPKVSTTLSLDFRCIRHIRRDAIETLIFPENNYSNSVSLFLFSSVSLCIQLERSLLKKTVRKAKSTHCLYTVYTICVFET